jgi:hypothetical protein
MPERSLGEPGSESGLDILTSVTPKKSGSASPPKESG